jgi:hypothetical protein
MNFSRTEGCQFRRCIVQLRRLFLLNKRNTHGSARFFLVMRVTDCSLFRDVPTTSRHVQHTPHSQVSTSQPAVFDPWTSNESFGETTLAFDDDGVRAPIMPRREVLMGANTVSDYHSQAHRQVINTNAFEQTPSARDFRAEGAFGKPSRTTGAHCDKFSLLLLMTVFRRRSAESCEIGDDV